MSKKKPKAAKLPKSIAGMKVPKELRKSGAALLAHVDTPAGREVIASGLTLAASALAAVAVKSREAAVAAAAKPAAERAEASAAADHGPSVEALGAAASAFVNGLFKPRP